MRNPQQTLNQGTDRILFALLFLFRKLRQENLTLGSCTGTSIILNFLPGNIAKQQFVQLEVGLVHNHVQEHDGNLVCLN
jgi:hypothetical protein